MTGVPSMQKAAAVTTRCGFCNYAIQEEKE